jgi:hypothetical protein
MLYYPDMRPVTDIPHRKDFAQWTGKMSSADLDAIDVELNRRIDADLAAGKQVQVAGWIPGADWSKEVWNPIYQVGCNQNFTASALCFGLIAWKVFMDRPDAWCFVGDATKPDGTPIQSKVYFRIDRP